MIVHNDDVNTFVGVGYVVHTVFGLPLDRAAELVRDVHTTGEALLTWCAGREQAEELVSRFQVWGIRATVRGSAHA